MIHFLFIAFYTTGTRYEVEAARLRRSLDRLGLDHDLRGVPDLGSWQANTHYTATFIRAMQQAYADRPLIYVDADAVVWTYPALFDSLDCDIAAHRMHGHELLNGTVYLAPNQAARDLVELWIAVNRERPGVWDQKNLDEALRRSPGVRFVDLPATYCQIFDLMSDAGEPVIEHLQASRECNEAEGSDYRRSRERRLAELAGL